MLRYALKRQLDIALETMMKMSQTSENYWGEFFLDIPVGILLVATGLQYPDVHPSTALLTFLVGLFLCSFFEYFPPAGYFKERFALWEMDTVHPLSAT